MDRAQFSVSCDRFRAKTTTKTVSRCQPSASVFPVLGHCCFHLRCHWARPSPPSTTAEAAQETIQNAKRLAESAICLGPSKGCILCLRSPGSAKQLVGTQICLGPVERLHPLSGITTTASWKRGMVGWLQEWLHPVSSIMATAS